MLVCGAPGAVSLHVVPYPLESRQANFIEWHMIGGSDTGNGERGSAKVFRRLEQGTENGPSGFVALQEDSANATRPVVEN